MFALQFGACNIPDLLIRLLNVSNTNMDGKFVSQLGHIGPNGTNLGLLKIILSTFWLGPKWDKSGSFKISFSSKNELKLILKSPIFVSFGANLTQIGCQI